MNPTDTARAIARLLASRPAHQEPRRVFIVRPLLFGVVVAAITLAPHALHLWKG